MKKNYCVMFILCVAAVQAPLTCADERHEHLHALPSIVPVTSSEQEVRAQLLDMLRFASSTKAEDVIAFIDQHPHLELAKKPFSDGYLPLDYACFMPVASPEVVQALVDRGADTTKPSGPYNKLLPLERYLFNCENEGKHEVVVCLAKNLDDGVLARVLNNPRFSRALSALGIKEVSAMKKIEVKVSE